MEEKKVWTCPSCHYEIHPGDQICRNCGANIYNTNIAIEDLREHSHGETSQEKRRPFPFLIVLGVLIFVLLLFLILWFLLMR